MTNLAHRLFATVLACFAAAAVAQQPWHVYPPAPMAGEPFVIQYEGSTPGGPTTVRTATVSVDGSTLTYSVETSSNDFAVPGPFRASTVVPGLAAGQYQVLLKRRGDFGADITSILGVVEVAAAPAPQQPVYRGLSGNWFDPGESGWGMNIVQGDSGALFAVWLTYLPVIPAETFAQRDGMWLVMPEGRWISPTRFRGLLYSASGTSVAVPFNRSDLLLQPVGYVSLDFSSPAHLSMTAEAGLVTPGFLMYAPIVKEATIRRFQF
jgi:hypothetical protein